MDMNHGVGGSNPSSPITCPRGNYLSLWGLENHDRNSKPKAMELGCGSFIEMECLFIFLFIINGGIITHSMPDQHIFLFYAP